ncbi:MAG: hypothetical protein Q7S79_04060 [bacterium]|nr:hypothetical protein [bacterium]
MPKKILLILIIILCFGFFLRKMYLPRGSVNFMYDQARDAYAVKEILSGHLKVLGPPSSSQGLSHGVFYYYLTAPAYLIDGGNPVVVSSWLALINNLGGLVVFLLACSLTKNYYTGLLATFLYAISFETTQYATWLANPGPAVVTVPLLYLGLWLWISGNRKWGPIISALGLGLSIQSQIFLIYHIIPLTLILWISRKSIKPKEHLIFCGILFTSLLTMILAEVKFGFQTTRGLLGIFTNTGTGETRGIVESFLLYISLFTKTLSRSISPDNLQITTVLVIAIILTSLTTLKKKKLTPELFVLMYLLSFTPIFFKVGENIPHIFVGLAPALLILLAMYLSRIWESKFKILAPLLLVFLTFSNLSSIVKENPKGQTLFATQKSLTIENEKALIDKTYEPRIPFSINNITAPLYINITWTYLYKWYGEKKYGYLPTYVGMGQEGQADSLEHRTVRENLHYLIIEPLWGVPTRYKDEIMIEEDARTNLVDEIVSGELVLQKRLKK